MAESPTILPFSKICKPFRNYELNSIMKKNVRLFLYIALAFYLCGSQAFGQELSKQPPAQKSQTTAHPPPIFVYSPVFLQRFKQNINTSIQKYPSLKKYQQIATKGFFDTAEKALASTPIPYTGACYRAKDRHGASSLRIAATRDAHYARTLSTVVRIFPDSPDWSFALKSSDGKIDYHFYRDRALQSAKGYLLAWSRRMQSADGLIPGATPKLQPCPGEKPAAAQGMNVSILAYSFVSVYELLYPYLSADEVRDFKSWLDKLKQEIIEGECQNAW